MRNSSPFFAETLKQMASDGIQNALGFILSSHRTEASWERYQKNIADARAELGVDAPAVDYCDGWHDHPLFMQTWVELIEAAFAKIDPARAKNSTPLIFTAHSLPTAMAARSPYVEQLEYQRANDRRTNSAGAIGGSLIRAAAANRADPWLEPDIGATIRQLAAEGHAEIVVAPIGFVCDHVEVLYDLDIEAKQDRRELGNAI